MKLRNGPRHYGLVSILLHWIMAALILGLFALGLYMVELGYYHPWYHKAPDLHRSLGILVALLLGPRWLWRLLNPQPGIEGEPWERRAALWVHRSFYLLIAATVAAGYLITTANGQGVPVFSLFEIPATLYGFDNQEDLAGVAHEWLAYLLIALVSLHTLAALKHHFVDRDSTLRRMLRPGGSRSSSSPMSTTEEQPP